MRVLMGLGYYEGGGFTTVVNSLAKHLQTKGVKVTVAVREIRIKPPSRLNITKLTPRAFLEEARKYDVVHIHTTYPYLNTLLNANFKNVIFTFHGYTPWWIVPGLKNKFIHLYLRFAYRSLLKKVPLNTAVSDFVKKQVKKLFGIESKLIYNGVDLSIFKSKNIDKNLGYPIIVNTTAWNKQKGLDLLIKHFTMIKEHYPEAILLAVGPLNPDRWTRRYLSNVAQEVEGVRILPYKPQVQLVYLYNLADFYLLTSRWESFCFPIVESFACGTPVIAYDKNDVRREHVTNSKAGLIYYDEESLLRAVEEILKRWNVYSRRAVSYAEKFDWKHIAEEYINVYNKVS